MSRIATISLTTAAPDVLEAFYRDAFGFERIGFSARIPTAILKTLAVANGYARATVLRLGKQYLQLLAFDEPGSPYPADVPGNDLRFQHFAIVAANMHRAYARLQNCRGWSPISHPEPQRLPASSGSVSAFKFRDPEGHPLELLAFAPEATPASWKQNAAGAECLGIDHSAISVADTARSVEFYRRRLGFIVSGDSCNSGIEQARLDGLNDPVVHVTALSCGSGEPPHLELLCYRVPAPRPPACPALQSTDLAATRLIVELDEESAGGAAELIHDPDGHALLLSGPEIPNWPGGAT